MVTIKVQSVDDIIKAYLQTLECCSTKKLSVLVPLLKNLLGNLDDKAVDVISLLDELVYKKSLTIFGNIKLTKSQMISLCKFCFLESGGFNRWNDELFLPTTSKNFKSALLEVKISNAPSYKLSHMLAQQIEPIRPKNIFHKLFSFRKKNDSL